MNIDNNLYVAFDYRLTLDSGEEVDQSPDNEPIGFITGSGRIIPGLEKAMMGMTVGEKSKIRVTPEDGYGPVNPSLIGDVPRSHFPKDMELTPGLMIQAQGPNGVMAARIKEVKDEDTVVIDLNHPLAGQALHFDVNIIEVRELTAEEVSGMVSGCGCCAEGEGDCGSCG